MRFRWPLFRDILRVGVVAALIRCQTNVTIAVATGDVGEFGPAAIAGYGTARARILLIPLVFGLGAPARRHGRNQYRRRAARARLAYRLDRRRNRAGL